MTLPPLILGNSNKRFSGVTSTMLQTLPEVQSRMDLVVLGNHHLPEGVPSLSFIDLLRYGRDGTTRVFHARRNDEMIQALLARRLGVKLKIAFTSTAQRHHTRFTKWLMSQMDGIITTCSGAASYLDKPADVTIPHGIDLERYHMPDSKAEAWRKLGLPGDFGIGIFGRVRPQKGIDLLVEAALEVLPHHPEPTVIIVGETTPKFLSFEKSLRAKIAQAGLEDRILFLGKKPSAKLPSLFQAVSLVAALSRNEGFGLTVPEAMASGCAVLASEAGAWKDIVEDGTHGRLVPCDDLEATTKALADLIDADLAAHGKAGRKFVEKHHTMAGEAEALVSYYLKLLDESSGRY